VLDGLEPLQYGPEGQQGALKDQGLRAFLRGVAAKQPATGHGLIVLTSRLAVYDLRKWQDSTAPLVDLGRLSDQAGAALLADGGVAGSPEALREAARDFAGHALALSLLAGFLRLLHGGDVSERSSIRAVTDDPKDLGHDQARRVIEAYESEWLAHEPILLAIMHLVGLFDRPASADCIMALRGKPIINGLTDGIVDLDDDAWRAAIARLREVRLLDPEDPSAPDALDAHPLVREWFGDRLKQTDEAASKAAHGRLYEHLRDATKEGKTPTLEDLAPLYQAIVHGCRAERYEETLKELYTNRICRRHTDNTLEFYSIIRLGAISSDLAMISWLFERPFELAVSALEEVEQSWILSHAAMLLRGQGRITEALPAQRKALRMHEAAKRWSGAATSANNLSETELLLGDVAAAVVTASKAVIYADRSQNDTYSMFVRTTRADALNLAGRRTEAKADFNEAERRQQQSQPEYPLLYSVQGYQYCDFLLAEGDWAAVRDRAMKTLGWFKEDYPLEDFALDRLMLGRAHLGLLLLEIDRGSPLPKSMLEACLVRDSLDGGVDGLRAAGTVDQIPSGLLARAAFRRNIGDWDGTKRDLDEVEEIAEPAPMKLFLCDMALERARLAFAKVEAFAPLNGLVDGGPPKLVEPDKAKAGGLKEEAAKQLAIAADYIESCGYHRRDEELAELQSVLRGDKTFAELPPRV
jgi:tetratricopeptide (TPR) repeat protein